MDADSRSSDPPPYSRVAQDDNDDRPYARHSVDAHHHAETYEGVHLATVAEKQRLWFRNAVINCLLILSWFCFGILLSLYNKWMFNFAFPFPLFVTSIHMLVQFTLAATIRYAFPRIFKPKTSPTRSDYMKKAVPTAVATGFDIGLGNLALKTISLSFYTMVKSSALIFVLLFAFLFKLETYSLRLVFVILLITAGVILMVATQTTFVFLGLILVLSASAFSGLRWSLTQLLLRKKDLGMNTPAATIFWLAPSMGITLALTSLAIESWVDVFWAVFGNGFGYAVREILLILLPGTIAFCMVMSEYYIIQRAGVVPMAISGTLKEVATITASAWLFGDELTPLNITGVGITFIGMGLYTWHKYQKSMNSTVPLDAHGNPIEEEEDMAVTALGLRRSHEGDVAEMRGLTSDVREEGSYTLDSAPGRDDVLFTVGDDEDGDGDDKHGRTDES